ncbi:MAG TPA: hypothetical protein VN700_19180 [Vicinamibacterales bacterium]|nr:hypothetical protein [Vicinamibacterales bacterium]
MLALSAAVLSSYPVVFMGMSYVSPNYGTPLLYPWLPALPGSNADQLSGVSGADVGALMWQHVPYSMSQHRALVRDGEWPLWNRYNSGGTPLLGQGQSMFGDPLHLPVIAARGAAWAWDLKFLAAKFLLAWGLALSVYTLTRHRGAAAIVCLAAPFVGFFVYRVNHPAFFSFCYAPWPLYCWLRLREAATLRAAAASLGGLVVANVALLASGTVKEAYLTLLCLNLAGGLVLLLDGSPRHRWAKLGAAVWTCALFVGLTMPEWRTFLDVLRTAYTSSDAAKVSQLSPVLLLGSFDEALFRTLSRRALVFQPSANFLFLAGCLYLLAAWRDYRRDRALLALGLATAIPSAVVYGLVPAAWIVEVPFMAQIHHLDATLGGALIILWGVLAGYGFAAAARRLGTSQGRHDVIVAGTGLAALVLLFMIGARGYGGPVGAESPLVFDRFVWGYLTSLLVALIAVAWIAHRALRRGHLVRSEAIGLVLCGLALFWRHGLHADVGLGRYALTAAPRADFHVPSPAVDWIKSRLDTGPARVAGVNSVLMGGWSGAHELEGITAPDALMNRNYRELMRSSPLRRQWDWRYNLTEDRSEVSRPILDMLNVRYYVADRATPPGGLPGVTWRYAADLAVFQSPTAWPRAFFTDGVLTYDTMPALLERLRNGDGRPFAAALASDIATERALEGLPHWIAGSRSAAAMTDRTVVPARDYKLTENTTTFAVTAPRQGVVVLTETYWPEHAAAELDGHPAPILRINHAFQGLVVPPGSHTVVVRYRPAKFDGYLKVSGFALGLLGVSGALAWGIGGRRARTRYPEP